MCAVFLCSHTTGCEAYSFATDRYGIFNVRTNLGACRTPFTRWGSDTKQVCTRVDSEGQKNGPSPCPTRRSNPGPSDLNSDSLEPLSYAPPPPPPPHCIRHGRTVMSHHRTYVVPVEVVSVDFLPQFRLSNNTPCPGVAVELVAQRKEVVPHRQLFCDATVKREDRLSPQQSNLHGKLAPHNNH